MAYDKEIKRKYRREWARAHPESGLTWKRAHREQINKAQHKRYLENPERYREYSRKWAEKNPEKRLAYIKAHPELARKAKLKAKYGITLERFDAMAKAQNFKCAICGKQEPLRVDHDHVTGQVRGLLCNGCNMGIGSFKDNALACIRASEYLLKYEEIDL